MIMNYFLIQVGRARNIANNVNDEWIARNAIDI